MADVQQIRPSRPSVPGMTNNASPSQYDDLNNLLVTTCEAVSTARAAEHVAAASLEAARVEVHKAQENLKNILHRHYIHTLSSSQERDIPQSSMAIQLPSYGQSCAVETELGGIQRNLNASFSASVSKAESVIDGTSQEKPQHLVDSHMLQANLVSSSSTEYTHFCLSCGVPETAAHLRSPSHEINAWWFQTAAKNLRLPECASLSATQKTTEQIKTPEGLALSAGSQSHLNLVKSQPSSGWSAECHSVTGQCYSYSDTSQSQCNKPPLNDPSEEWHEV